MLRRRGAREKKQLKNGSNTSKFEGFNNSISKTVLNVLQTIHLGVSETGVERVTVVTVGYYRMNWLKWSNVNISVMRTDGVTMS